MPLLLRRYRTCSPGSFIDAATIVLALCEKKYVRVLREKKIFISIPFWLFIFCAESPDAPEP